MNGDQFHARCERLQSIPHRVLSLHTAGDELEFFLEVKCLREFGERGLHSVAHDQNDFVNVRRRLKAPPGVGNDGLAGNLEEKLVDIGSHAGAPAGGDDDGGCHGGEFRG